jgi:hypothetical protein
VDLDTKGGKVLLLELTSQVTFDKGGLSFVSTCRLKVNMLRMLELYGRGAVSTGTSDAQRCRDASDRVEVIPFQYHRRQQAQA